MSTIPTAVHYREHIVDRGAPRPVEPDVPVDLSAITLFRRESFPDAGPAPWLDRDNALVDVGLNQLRGTIDAEEADACRQWARDGYVVVENVFDGERLDWVWSEYQAAVDDGRLVPPHNPQYEGDPWPARMLNAHFKVPAIDEMLHSPELTRWVDLLLGVKCLPFQSIAFHKASQQEAHSDSIHMTTYPLGYLVGAWVAFEDVYPGTGELLYYPGSHREPYVLANDLGIVTHDDRQDEDGYVTRYIPAIERTIADGGYEEKRFLARKGDVIFWHANFLHGGSRRTDFTRTRHSIVFHYYAEGCVCYHDWSGRRAWVHDDVRPY